MWGVPVEIAAPHQKDIDYFSKNRYNGTDQTGLLQR